jgi:excinuclease ABC subunit B
MRARGVSPHQICLLPEKVIRIELCAGVSAALLEEWLLSHQAAAKEACGVLREAGMDVDLTTTISELEEEMLTAANNLEFEKAALCRDQIKELKRALDDSQPAKETKANPVSYRKGKRTSGRR